MANLRHLNIREGIDGDNLLRTVFTVDTNPMIVITGTGEPEFYNTIEDKAEAMLNLNINNDIVLFVWEGKKRTDVFLLTVEDLSRIAIIFSNG